MWIIMLTTSMSLLLASTAIGIFDFLSSRERLARDLTLIANNAGSSNAPNLDFDNPENAERNLKGLSSLPNIVSADLFTADGQPFAHYQRDGIKTRLQSVLREPGQYFTNDFLDVYQPIRRNDRFIGTIHVRSDGVLREMQTRLSSLGLIVVSSFFGSLAVAYLLSSRLQRIVSVPIRRLAELERRVSQQQNYSIRAAKEGNDEVGVLIDGFNEMLAQIQIRDEELSVAKEKAEEANRTKSGFLANMSHELRTPLNGILGFTEMMMEEAGDRGDDHLQPDLEKINAAGKHLLALINDILDLSKIEAGKMELYYEEVDLPSAVNDVATTVRSLVKKNQNQFEVYCPADLGIVLADLTRLRQILFNLLTNAAKFTEGGTVELHVSREYVHGAQWTIFEIKDTGIGISREQLDKLFLAFSQADATTTRRFGGTGLGLTISRQIARMMGGDISVESELGKGSTFTVALPLQRAGSDEKQQLPAPIDSHDRRGAHGTTVLIIDDDPNARELLHRLLEKEGFQTYTARDGEDGLRLARKVAPAVITLDVFMPSMDGWAVLTALKSDPVLANIPVVVVSIVDNKEMGFSLGAADYVTKPVDRDRLISIISRYRHNGAPSVLLIEDEPDSRQHIAKALQNEGWSVTEASNGAEGLRAVERSRPDLILLDLPMPEMDGFDFIEKLHSEDGWRSIPVIVITAKDITKQDRIKLKGRVETILLKHQYSIDELVQEIRAVAASRNPARQ
jgi:signal transduction histidine kinase/DNA-binding response OmpR family regulator